MKKVSDVAGCSGCPMQRKFPDNVFVPPKLGTSTRLVIAEAPGETETFTGEPLTGGAGKWFNIISGKAGVSRDTITITNCIQCRPPDNVFPTDSEARKYISKEEAVQAVQHCYKAHVVPTLRSKKWSRIDLLGDKPLRIIAGKFEGIGTWRGSPIAVPELGDKPIAIATYHPAYIMRDQEVLPVAINDMRKPLTPPEEHYLPFPSIEQVRGFKADVFAFDIETPKYRTLGDHAPVEMVGLCAASGEAMCVPVWGEYLSELRRIFAAATSVIGHNCIQFDLPRLQGIGVVISRDCQIYDTMLLQHLRFPNLAHDLEFVGSQFTSKPAWKHDKSSLEVYCCRDTDVTYQCWLELKPLIESYKLMDLYKKVQVPLAQICHLMQTTGFKLDPGQIARVRKDLTAEMEKLELDLPPALRSITKKVMKRQAAPAGTLSPKTGKPVKYVMAEAEERETPWRSATVIAKYLYEELALPVIRDLKTDEITTGKMALAKLYGKTKRPEIAALQKLRKMNSLLTLFAKKEMLRAEKQHPHFNVHGTASGRLSSSDPNLQNVPESARYLYVPSVSGWKVIDVDYQSIENRLTAHLAGDKERLDRFRDPDYSEHKHAASLFFDIPYNEVIKDNDKDAPYGKAKRIVHGTNYGMGSKKISMMYDMDFKETRDLQARWKNAIKATSEWQERAANQARRDGYLVTPFGRRRWFYTTSWYTESLSFLPQSTAADVLYRAMLALMYERIGWPKERLSGLVTLVEPLPQPARLLLSVHDSLVFECPNEEVDNTVGVIKRVMEQPWKELGGLSIPVGVAVGDSWGGTHKYISHSTPQSETK